MRKTTSGEQIEHSLLKPGVNIAALTAAMLPPVLPPGGLTGSRVTVVPV